jgi:hypothetical protein
MGLMDNDYKDIMDEFFNTAVDRVKIAIKVKE